MSDIVIHVRNGRRGPCSFTFAPESRAGVSIDASNPLRATVAIRGRRPTVLETDSRGTVIGIPAKVLKVDNGLNPGWLVVEVRLDSALDDSE